MKTRNHKAALKRAGKRAGKPNYPLADRYYPEWMPDTPKGVNQPLVGYWHMRRLLRWKLGYVSIDGKRNDEWTTYTAEKIAHFHNLIKIADEELKKGEKDYYDKLKEKEKAEYEEIRKGILSDIYDQTDSFLEKRKKLSEPIKQCLNSKGELDMAKMTFDEMMEWSKKQKDFEGSSFNWLKLTQGIHCLRFLSSDEDNYFVSYTQHDCGQAKDFKSWLCWDWIIDNKDVADFFEEKELLTEAEVKRIKKLGCPVCTTLEVIKKYLKNMEPVYNVIRTKTRCLFNVFYVYQAYPDVEPEKRIQPGNYLLEKSAGFNKLIISAMNKDLATSMEEDQDPLELVSVDNGKLVALQVEGEGIGKNKRTYTIDFKGKSGPIYYTESGSNPYVKGAQRISLPDDFQMYNLLDGMAMRFLPHQEVINQLKAIPLISKILEQIGYEIPGDEPSDNPLDQNYDKSYAQRTVGKPIAVKKINEDSPLSKVQKNKKEEWEDEEVLVKEEKTVQSKKVVEIEEDEDVPWEDEVEDEFEKAVPKSDPRKEVITNAPKKRKVF